MPIYSLQVEKHAIGGLIKHPQVFSEISPFVNEKDFYNDVHLIIFCVIRDSIEKKERIDKVLVAQKVKNLGVFFKDDIDIFEYIDSVAFTQITPEATVDAFKELITLRIRREYHDLGSKLQTHAKTSGNKSADEIITEGDSIFGNQASSYTLNEEPKNLFEDIEKFVEERANNPLEDTGYSTPYPTFNRLYGGLRKKNLYAIVSRPAEGKSTFLSDICFRTSLMTGFKTRALLLDTEMETEDIRWRIVSSISGVPMWYLETGNWVKNQSMEKSVRAALKLTSKYQFDHMKVGNKTADQVCSITRRWYYSKVGRGGDAIVAYDYVKVTGEKMSESWKEYQVIGEKIDKFKKLSEDIDSPIVVAMQLNRTGDNKNKKAGDFSDDSSAIATSDRLQWFASYVGIFRRKTLEEIAEDGVDFGTHKSIPLKTRFQGKDAAGHQDIIKRKFKDGTEKWTSNYINFNVNNFHLEEKGDVNSIINSQKISMKNDNDNEAEDLL